MTDTKKQQLIINVGTEAQIQSAIQSGTITSDMISFSTDYETFATQNWVGQQNYQTTANLTTSISSSSTNTEYPSAAAVYNFSKGYPPPDYSATPTSLATSTLHQITQNGWVLTSGSIRIGSNTGKQVAGGGALTLIPMPSGNTIYVSGMAADFFPCISS